jgi:hypothetical protein
MALSGKSLDAATTTGPGMAITFDVPKAAHTLVTTFTGSPSQVIVHLEITLDGSNWVTITQTSGVASTINYSGAGNTPALGARANLVELTGGTSPTVTAFVASA